jgi:murein DD-endopeptidase MepM/ murein hydrolase activator NlpD
VYEDPLTQVTEAATERETYREGMISIKEPGEIFELPPRYIFPIHEDDFLWDGIRGDLTSPSGERDPANIGGLGDGFHEGFDSWGISEVVTWQARVVAVADGVVRNHWYNDPVKGEVIEILHDDGSVSESSHLSEAFVKERRVLADGSMIPWRVKQGDVIGRIGNTGMSKGKYKYKTHLHFSLRLPDEETGELEYVNPLSYIPIPE